MEAFFISLFAMATRVGEEPLLAVTLGLVGASFSLAIIDLLLGYPSSGIYLVANVTRKLLQILIWEKRWFISSYWKYS
jgi:hypothetical protein